ncbi:hypothetical protein ACQJBY_047592 [Aegilops geniculata]
MGGGSRDKRKGKAVAVAAAAAADAEAGGKGKEAAAAPEEELREGRKQVLKLIEQNRVLDAVRLSTDVAGRHPKSAAALNVKAYALGVAGHQTSRAIESSRYHQASAEAYGAAADLEPRCVLTATLHGKALQLCGEVDEAYLQLRRAGRIPNPIDPALTGHVLPNTRDMEERKGAAVKRADDELIMFVEEAEEFVRIESGRLMLKHSEAESSTEARQARVEAKILASKYPFSARAQILFPTMYLGFTQNLPPQVPKMEFYEHALRQLQDAADTFDRSLVIVLLRAQILFAMGRSVDARQECRRGLDIDHPTDPLQQDIPPGRFFMKTRAKRISSVTAAITALMQDIDLTLPQNAQPADDLERQLDIDNVNHIPEDKLVAESNTDDAVIPTALPCHSHSIDAPPVVHEGIRLPPSLLYANPKRKYIPPPDVRPEQKVNGRIVSMHIVDRYAEYLHMRAMCPAKKVVCHLCVFEKGPYVNTFKKGDIIWHCGKLHGPESTIQCDQCAVRVRTPQELELHVNYCHVLRGDWYKKWC